MYLEPRKQYIIIEKNWDKKLYDEQILKRKIKALGRKVRKKQLLKRRDRRKKIKVHPK